MANIFKTTDSSGLFSMLRDFALAIRQFFATKNEMDVVAQSLTDLDSRKVNKDDNDLLYQQLQSQILVIYNGALQFRLGTDKEPYNIGTLYPNGHNQLLSIPYVTASHPGVLKSKEYTALIDMLNAKYATENYVQTYVGNGKLVIKNGEKLLNEAFTANKQEDTTIDLGAHFIDKDLFTQTDNTDSPNNIDEENAESGDTIFSDKDLSGYINLKFFHAEDKNKHVDLPIYSVNVDYLTDVVEPSSLSSIIHLCFFVDVNGIDLTGLNIDDYYTTVLYVRGVNINNKICEYDVRGNNGTNTVVVNKYLHYLYMQCTLKLHNTDNSIVQNIRNFSNDRKNLGYLCLRNNP